MKVKIDGYVIETDKIVAIQRIHVDAEFRIFLSGENCVLIKRDCRSGGISDFKRDYTRFESADDALAWGLEQDSKDIEIMYNRLMAIWHPEPPSKVKEEILDITA